MRKEKEIRDLLTRALRLLNNQDDNSWHLYYKTELWNEIDVSDNEDEIIYKIAAFLESPDGYNVRSQLISVAVTGDWQLHMEALLLCLNLYMQQTVMPVDDPLTIHTISKSAFNLLAEAQIKRLDLLTFLSSREWDKVTEKVITGFVFLVNLLPEVKLELE
jgi:hypothetical protein